MSKDEIEKLVQDRIDAIVNRMENELLECKRQNHVLTEKLSTVQEDNENAAKEVKELKVEHAKLRDYVMEQGRTSEEVK